MKKLQKRSVEIEDLTLREMCTIDGGNICGPMGSLQAYINNDYDTAFVLELQWETLKGFAKGLLDYFN